MAGTGGEHQRVPSPGDRHRRHLVAEPGEPDAGRPEPRPARPTWSAGAETAETDRSAGSRRRPHPAPSPISTQLARSSPGCRGTGTPPVGFHPVDPRGRVGAERVGDPGEGGFGVGQDSPVAPVHDRALARGGDRDHRHRRGSGLDAGVGRDRGRRAAGVGGPIRGDRGGRCGDPPGLLGQVGGGGALPCRIGSAAVRARAGPLARIATARSRVRWPPSSWREPASGPPDSWLRRASPLP